MTPLFQALTDAAQVGLDAPKCHGCSSRGWYAGQSRNGETVNDETLRDCLDCHATGLDASDPYGLIGRVFVYAGWNALSEEVIAEKQCYTTRIRGEVLAEPHDRTLQGRATALLRLVARAGPRGVTP